MGNFASTDYILAGSTSRSITFALQSRVTIANLRYGYSRKNEGATYDAAVSGALSALGSLGAAHSPGGAYYLSATVTDPGYFLLRVDFPDGAFATGRDKVLCSIYDDDSGEIAHRIFTLKGDDSIYADGAVWSDSVDGGSGAVPYVNGIPSNPMTVTGGSLASTLGLKRLRLVNPASVFTLGTADLEGLTVISDCYPGIDIDQSDLEAAAIVGCRIYSATAANYPQVGSGYLTLVDCLIGGAVGANLPLFKGFNLSATNIFNLSNAGQYEIAGLKTADDGVVLDFKRANGVDPGAATLIISGFSGRLTVKNMLTTDSLEISGEGEVIFDTTCNSATATARVSGAIVVTNNATDLLLTDNTAGHIPTLKKNTPVNNYTFVMIDATTGNPATGKSPAAQVSLNGAAFTGMVNTPAVEISNGVYKINIAAADVNGDTGAFRFTATGCEATIITFITES
jgi:hypothetical protein